MRNGRIVGAALGAGAIVSVAAVLMYRRRLGIASTGSPRERLFSQPPWPPPPPPPPSTFPAPASTVTPPLIPPGAAFHGDGNPDSPEFWFPIVSALIATDYKRIDPRIAMQWLTIESGGNPCEFGEPGAKGPDGEPLELGLGQIYNPDDFKKLGLTSHGITPSAFRSYCAPNTQHRTRKLTPKEMEDQVRYTLLAKIDSSMGVADRAVSTYGLHWPMADYWKLVKSVHAWPPILNTGLPAVVKKLGRAPSRWSEFRQALGMDALKRDEAPRSKTFGQLIPKFPQWRKGLNNAEKLGNVIADVGSV